MKPLQGQLVTVAGAGAFGLVTALRLADAGAAVTVCDPTGSGANASAVAAGMLAPAFESVLEAGAGCHFFHLAEARDLWPGLARRVGLDQGLDRSGALLAGRAGDEAALAEVWARLEALGLEPKRLTGAQARTLHPGLAAEVDAGLFVAEDWRLAPAAMLAALIEAIVQAGGRIVAAPLEARDGALQILGRRVEGAVVIATGANTNALAEAAPELARLSAVKGQILQFDAGPTHGPVVRGLAGYLAPQVSGILAGASMEPGRTDVGLDAGVLARLRADAARLFPHLADAPATGRAGVRAASPDGLPLVGPSAGGADVVLCAGARRNGWLLAPLAAEIVLQTLTGGATGPAAAAFDPRRFG